MTTRRSGCSLSLTCSPDRRSTELPWLRVRQRGRRVRTRQRRRRRHPQRSPLAARHDDRADHRARRRRPGRAGKTAHPALRRRPRAVEARPNPGGRRSSQSRSKRTCGRGTALIGPTATRRGKLRQRAVTGRPTITRSTSSPSACPGLDEAAFIEHATAAKAGRPVSRALAGVPEITLEASLTA